MTIEDLNLKQPEIGVQHVPLKNANGVKMTYKEHCHSPCRHCFNPPGDMYTETPWALYKPRVRVLAVTRKLQ